MMREEARVAASRNPTPLSQKRRGDSHKLRLFMSKMSQVMKERCGRPTGAVVVSRPVCRLVRVGREQAAAVESMLEADVDGRARRLEAAARDQWLGKRAADQVPVVVEDEDVGRERIGRVEISRPECGSIVAFARQPVARFEHIDLEGSTSPAKGKPRWEIQPGSETRHFEARRTTMSSPLPGLNCADSPGQSGFATVAAWAVTGAVQVRTPAA